MTFRTPGQWGVKIRMLYKGKTQVLRTSFAVAPHSTAPAVGSPAIKSNNPTIHQKSILKLDSGRPPDDMHMLSIAQAIVQHKPLVVLFSTPAFCESRMCGPQTEIVKLVEAPYRSRVNFIHIEVYQNANLRDGYAPTLLQWHLLSEPWVFVVDLQGIIHARFDGPTSGPEIVAAVNGVLRK